MLTIQTGIMSGWTSPNMARLTSENSTIPLTLSQASWVASCLNLGRFVSVVLVPILMEILGTKKSLLFSFIPVSISWIIMVIANSATMLYIARFLNGVTCVLTYACFPIFLGEVSAPSLRGTLISIANVGWPLGQVVGTIAETYLPMSSSSKMYLTLCLLGIVLCVCLPESPYELVKKNKMNKARESLSWYRGRCNDNDKEIGEITEFVQSNGKQTIAERIGQLKSAPIMKTLILIIILFSFPSLCGSFSVLFYTETILINGKSFLVDPKEMVIYVNVLLFVSSVLSANLIDKLGRRILLLITSSAITISMIGLGLHYYLLFNNLVDPVSIQWLPVASIALYVLTYTVGFVSVPSTILGEIFPANIKSTAAFIASAIQSLLGFAAAKAYQPMVDAIGEVYVFWIHAGITSLAIPIALFVLPETKGKSLQQIQKDLKFAE